MEKTGIVQDGKVGCRTVIYYVLIVNVYSKSSTGPTLRAIQMVFGGINLVWVGLMGSFTPNAHRVRLCGRKAERTKHFSEPHIT